MNEQFLNSRFSVTAYGFGDLGTRRTTNKPSYFPSLNMYLCLCKPVFTSIPSRLSLQPRRLTAPEHPAPAELGPFEEATPAGTTAY